MFLSTPQLSCSWTYFLNSLPNIFSFRPLHISPFYTSRHSVTTNNFCTLPIIPCKWITAPLSILYSKLYFLSNCFSLFLLPLFLSFYLPLLSISSQFLSIFQLFSFLISVLSNIHCPIYVYSFSVSVFLSSTLFSLPLPLFQPSSFIISLSWALYLFSILLPSACISLFYSFSAIFFSSLSPVLFYPAVSSSSFLSLSPVLSASLSFFFTVMP